MKQMIAELVRLRKAWGLSQDDLAELLDVGKNTVSLWENCSRTPAVKTLFKWASVLGCDIKIEFRGRGNHG